MTHVGLNLIALPRDAVPQLVSRVRTAFNHLSLSAAASPCNTLQMLINLERTMITAAGNWLLLASHCTPPYTPLKVSALKMETVARRLISMLPASSWNGVHHHKAFKWPKFLHIAQGCNVSNTVTGLISCRPQVYSATFAFIWIPSDAPSPHWALKPDL